MNHNRYQCTPPHCHRAGAITKRAHESQAIDVTQCECERAPMHRTKNKMASFVVGKGVKDRGTRYRLGHEIPPRGEFSRAHLVQSQELLRGHAAAIALLDILPFLLLALPLLLIVLLRGLLHKVKHLLTR